MRNGLVLAFAAAALAATPALSVGSNEEEAPPRPSETTTVCEEGQVWDADLSVCVPIEEATEDNAALRPIVRELAYADRFADASALLDRMPADDGFVLTYRGFIARQTGDFALAERYYQAAIAADPGNLLARSYYGMGLAQQGDRAGGQSQLDAIVALAGAEVWPARALRDVLNGAGAIGY